MHDEGRPARAEDISYVSSRVMEHPRVEKEQMKICKYVR